MKKLLFLSIFAILLASCTKDDLVIPASENNSDPPVPAEKTVTINGTVNLEEGLEVFTSWMYFYQAGIIDQITPPISTDSVNTFVIEGELAEKLLNSTGELIVSLVIKATFNGKVVNVVYSPSQGQKIKVKEVNDVVWDVVRDQY